MSGNKTVPTLEFREGVLHLLDQKGLPATVAVVECRDELAVVEAIKQLQVRGAPAIGLAASYGVVLAGQRLVRAGRAGMELRTGLHEAMERLGAARPTAVNLSWALRRLQRIVDKGEDETGPALVERLRREADRMVEEDETANRRMGTFGADLIADGANILTHCNTGALAAAAFGTALGVIRAAHEQGKRVHVWVDETRPLLQGARLTAWELQQLGIPCTLITDSMAGHFMARGKVDAVIVGADRIAANGDTANKIGTYSVALLAAAHHLPFYVAAPISTVDLATPSGDRIPIEERRPEEVTGLAGRRIAPEGVAAANPAFDVTPAELIAAIVTDRGVARPPLADTLARLAAAERALQRSVGGFVPNSVEILVDER